MSYGKHKVEHIIQGIQGIGKTVLTVGTDGQYANIQAAIDYISTLENFTAYSPLTAPTTVTAWAQNASSATVGAATSGAAIEVDTWFKLADDTFAYPLEGMDMQTPSMVSAIRRIEASLAATSKAITYYKQITHTVLLLEKDVRESILINANINVRFVSLVGTKWDSAAAAGAIQKGAAFLYGSISFGPGVTIVNDGASGGAFLSGSGAGNRWVDANCVRFRFEMGSSMTTISADGISPLVKLGDLLVTGTHFSGCGNIGNSHFLHVICGGDVKVLNSTYEINGTKIVSFLAPDLRFMDKVVGRKVIVDGLNCVVSDPNGRLSDVIIIGGLADAACNYVVSNVSLSLLNATAANLTLVEEGTAAGTAIRIDLSSCRINGLLSSGTKKVFKTTTHASGSAATVFASQCSGGAIDTPTAGSKTVDNAFAT